MTSPASPSFATLWKSRLSRRLLTLIGLFSLLGILVAIGAQLFSEYRRDLDAIQSRLQYIASSYVPPLAASAFQMDEEQVRLQLRGVLQLQDIVHVRVRQEFNADAYDISEGDSTASAAISRDYPLSYQTHKPVPVGTLTVAVSLDGVYERLRERALRIVFTSVLLVVSLALAILVVFQVALNRHLTRMAGYAAGLGLESLDQPLRLQRPLRRPEEADELDQLVDAINGMRERIRDDMRHRLEAEQELVFRKALFECVLEARIDGICIAAEDRTCLFGNSQFRTLWRLDVDCVPGAPMEGIFAGLLTQLAEPESLRATLDLVERDPETTVQGEMVLRSEAVYEYSTVPVHRNDGVRIGRLWSFRDISQRRELEDQLRQSRKLETLGNLAGGIAHDFNNLLSPIIGYAELGMEQLRPGDPLHVDLGHILKAAGRAADLTRQILAFSRKQMLEVEIIDLNDLLADIETMLRRLIGEAITIQVLVCPHPALIRADRSQIEQVVLNMAINARDAMPDGGTLTIETTEVHLGHHYVEQHAEVVEGDYVLLSVSDTGTGIDEAIRDRIFEPFFTTKERGKGTGLGLATAFGIVRQHQGHLWVYSEPGHGTIFKIYLPRVEGTPRAAATEATPPWAPPASGQCILVVEDDTMVRELVCDTLGGQGYRILEAGDPDSALEHAARTADIDLLLTDVILPKMNGRELHRQLAARLPGLKVLYMSGYTENVIADQGMLHAGVDFIQKPFSVRTLLHKVRQVLE